MIPRRTSLAIRVTVLAATLLSLLFLANLMLQAYRQMEYRFHLDINIAHRATSEIMGALETRPRVAIRDPGDLDYYARPEAPLNAFRVLDPHTGETLLTGGNPTTLDRLPIERHDLSTTAQEVEEAVLDGRELIWGIVRHDIGGGRDVMVEVAIDRQTRGLQLDAFVDELIVDLHLGWLIAFIGVVLMIYLSIRAGLAPLVEARRALRAGRPLDAAPPAAGDRRPVRAGGEEVDAFLDDLRDTFARQGAILQAQQEFVGRAAHELRTPLATMALDLATIDDERVRAIEADVQDLATKIANMLAWARLDAGADAARGPVDLPAVARRVVEGLEVLAQQRDILLIVEVRDPAPVTGDAISVEEAVRNLVENAIRHGKADSRVVIACGPGPRIVVEDEGPGFGGLDPELLCRPFWRGNTSTLGSGLGLALVRRVAERHAATLDFGASTGGGAKVTLNFQPDSAQHKANPQSTAALSTL